MSDLYAPVDLRLRFSPEQSQQYRADKQTIEDQMGTTNNRYLILQAVHLWAEQIRNPGITAAAHPLYAWAKLWLEAIQESAPLRATLAALPANAGPHMVDMLTAAIDIAEGRHHDNDH